RPVPLRPVENSVIGGSQGGYPPLDKKRQAALFRLSGESRNPVLVGIWTLAAGVTKQPELLV
ncbi:MAG: hypothetical protein KKH28_06785, partial [Elusimicrobia bacterium]|nr:hypothetical protein [Elusimicrobiota bacterium]